MASVFRSLVCRAPKIEAIALCNARIASSSNTTQKCFSSVTQNNSSILKSLGSQSMFNIRGLHTKGDQEIVSFLSKEISGEKETLVPKLPTHLDGFAVSSDRATLTLTRKFEDEEIIVTMNVNHSVEEESAETEEGVELKSRPEFQVEVKANGKSMAFSCEFLPEPEAGEGEVDLFGISEITVYKDKWNEVDYAVSGEILDEKLYDLMLNYLEERGISEQFADKMSTLCTDHEHSQYVSLLEGIQTFIARK